MKEKTFYMCFVKLNTPGKSGKPGKIREFDRSGKSQGN